MSCQRGRRHEHRNATSLEVGHQLRRLPRQPRRDAIDVGGSGGAHGDRPDHRRAALRRSSSQARQDAGARAHRGARRSEHPVPRTLGPRSVGDAGSGRRRRRPGHRRDRRSRVRDHRHGHERQGWCGQSDHVEEESTIPRDRPREPAATDQPQRVSRRRPATPGRPLHPGRGQLQGAHATLESGHPDHHRGVRTEHGGRRLHAGYERLHDLRQGRRHRISRWAAAGEDGHRRDRRRRVARWRRDALAHQWPVRLPRTGRDGRPADHPPDRPPPRLEEARPGPDDAGRRPAVRPDGVAGVCVGRRAHPVRHPRGATPGCSTAAASRSSSR